MRSVNLASGKYISTPPTISYCLPFQLCTTTSETMECTSQPCSPYPPPPPPIYNLCSQCYKNVVSSIHVVVPWCRELCFYSMMRSCFFYSTLKRPGLSLDGSGQSRPKLQKEKGIINPKHKLACLLPHRMAVQRGWLWQTENIPNLAHLPHCQNIVRKEKDNTPHINNS